MLSFARIGTLKRFDSRMTNQPSVIFEKPKHRAQIQISGFTYTTQRIEQSGERVLVCLPGHVRQKNRRTIRTTDLLTEFSEDEIPRLPVILICFMLQVLGYFIDHRRICERLGLSMCSPRD